MTKSPMVVLKWNVNNYFQVWSHVFRTTILNNDQVFKIDINNVRNGTLHIIRSSIDWRPETFHKHWTVNWLERFDNNQRMFSQ
jgi:hypothetical protein